jgi:4-amino-4-deoxy-L-arabinose transferase-like glycosyltransferase
MSKPAKNVGGRESTRADVTTNGLTGTPLSKRPTSWEWLLLALILAVGAWLRFSHLGLLEFQGDEAYAANLAMKCVREGKLPSAGLMSSVGVTNPPLFIYLLIPMFAINANPVFVSGCIAALGLGAVAACWWVGRKYYGQGAGLTAAAFFAVSPWAVIYSRKIWAQDFVPVFATATMWAVHALVLGKKPKAIFWAVLLPLCVVQIHFSGLALTAAVLAILLWLRPKTDWRFAAGGLVTALVLMIPYLQLQNRTDWADFRQATNAVGGGQQWEQLHGVTTHPVSGYRLPSKQNLSYALAIMNAGRIEDVLGISATPEFDRAQVWAKKPESPRYFTAILRFGEWPLLVQRLAFVAALVWLAVGAVRGMKKLKVEDEAARAAWILVLWFVVPVGVFVLAGLWTYLTYFAILFPVHFLACGAAARRLKLAVTAGIVGVLAAANVVFMLDYYRFVGQNGGAQGTFGTALGIKQRAARYLAERGGERLRADGETQLAFATAHSQEEREALARKIGQPQLVELNHEGKPELPQLEWPFLITQQPAGAGAWPTNTTVVLVDGNREALQPQQWQQLEQFPKTNFGPIRIYFVKQG